MADVTYEKLISYLLGLLARKRYTIAKIREKADKYVEKSEEEVDAKIVEKAISRLMELGYVNDLKFACDYVATKSNLRPKGEFLLRRELEQKGIDGEQIDDALRENQFDEVALARRLVESRKHQLELLDERKRREKISRLLLNRGFSTETIYKLLESCYSRFV